MTSDRRDHRRSDRAGRPGDQRRGRARASDPLSQDVIVDAAIELIDQVGIEGLSMRKVASVLGVGVMSLYWYVAHKENLLNLVSERIFRDLDLPADPSGDWKADLRLLAMRTFDVFNRHPWVVHATESPRPQIGDAFMRHIEFSFGSLSQLGVEPETMLRITAAIDDYVLGSAVSFAASSSWAGRRADLDELGTQFDEILATGRYPYSSKLRPQFERFWTGRHSSADDRSRFLFGLDSLLDGIESRLRAEGYLERGNGAEHASDEREAG